MKESEDPGKFLSLYWLESDLKGKTVGDITKSENRWKKQRGGTRMSVSVGQSGNDLEYFPVAETNLGKRTFLFQIRGCWIGLTKGDRKALKDRYYFNIVNKRDYCRQV